jgi:hypothetical protein
MADQQQGGQADAGKTYQDSTLSLKDYPQTKIEFLMDRTWDLLAEVETKAEQGKASREWPNLVQSYHDLYMRTLKEIEEPKRYKVSLSDDKLEACQKMEEFLTMLQEKGFFVVAKEEVIL